jgi:hypothetical protein
MKKFAQQIEQNMTFLMSGDLKKSLNKSDAVSHLTKALALLENAGLKTHSSLVKSIIKRAELIDESDIEVIL